VSILLAGPDVARDNPTPDTGPLQHGTGGICRCFILA
jgi:hypothetical protein